MSPLPSCAHELAPSEPEPGMCEVTVMAGSTRSCPPCYLGRASPAVLVRPAEGQRTGWCCHLFLRPPLLGGRVRVPSNEQSLEQGRQHFRLPPAGDCCVGCLASFLSPTAPCQKEAWGQGEDPGPRLSVGVLPWPFSGSFASKVPAWSLRELCPSSHSHLFLEVLPPF